MKLVAPTYFKDFKCIADKCKDSCCIGWEIDIDKKTSELYKNINGNFGKKLKENINFNENSSFILDKTHRCPFLNNKNLCEIYINLGENNLCEICKEHPRFYEWFEGIKEAGIGLCCEETCRIILSQNKHFNTYEIPIPIESFEEYDSNIYNYLYTIRKNILEYLDNENFSIDTTKNILLYANSIQTNLNNKVFENVKIPKFNSTNKNSFIPILEFFTTLEPFDINWIQNLKTNINLYPNYIENISEFEKQNKDIFKYLQNISVYFIWRYFLKGVFDNDVLSKVKLMFISINIIKYLFFCEWFKNKTLTPYDCINITKNYSKEIEYCEENLLKIYDASYDNNFFSTEYLLNI